MLVSDVLAAFVAPRTWVARGVGFGSKLVRKIQAGARPLDGHAAPSDVCLIDKVLHLRTPQRIGGLAAIVLYGRACGRYCTSSLGSPRLEGLAC